MQDDLSVICRPPKSDWMTTLFISGFGIFCMLPQLLPAVAKSRPEDRSFAVTFFFFGIIWLAICIVWTAYLLRAQIFCDSNGLRWRGLGRWQTASWDQVIDYYNRLPKRNEMTVRMSIVTMIATVRLCDNWLNSAQLREVVTARATQAPVTTWDTIGARRVDNWPREFEYKRDYNLVVFALTILTMFLLLIVRRLPFHLIDITWYGWADIGGWLLLCSVLFSHYYFMACLIRPALQGRQNQRIICDLRGISFNDTKLQTNNFVEWHAIKDFHIGLLPGRIETPGRYIVATNDEMFDFTRLITNIALLKVIIETYAINSATQKWEQRVSDDLQPFANHTMGGAATYDYGTRSNRALLLFFGVCDDALANSIIQRPNGDTRTDFTGTCCIRRSVASVVFLDVVAVQIGLHPHDRQRNNTTSVFRRSHDRMGRSA